MPVTMPTSANMLLKVEDAAVASGPGQMADSGDAKNFTCAGTRFSLCGSDENGLDRRPQVRMDGLMNGCKVIPASSGANNSIDVYPGSAWISNTQVSVTGVINLYLTRPSDYMVKIVSVTVDSAGNVGLIDGAEGSALSQTRGADGGPPYIPAAKIELATVQFSSSVSADIDGDDLLFAPEWSHAPAYRLLPYSAGVEFAAPLAAIHTGATTRGVWITWYEPQLTQLDVISFSPPVSGISVDPGSGASSPSGSQSGSMALALSGTQADLARRIDGKVRLFEFMPDSSGSRKELSYLGVEISAAYSPDGGIMNGKAILKPAFVPTVETV